MSIFQNHIACNQNTIMLPDVLFFFASYACDCNSISACCTGGIKPNVSTLGAEQIEFYSSMEKQTGYVDLLRAKKDKKGLSSSNKHPLTCENASKTIETQHHGYKSISDSSMAGVSGDGDIVGNINSDDDANSNNDNDAGECNNCDYQSEHNKKIQEKKELFFNWFYFSISFGSLFSYSIVAYLCQSVSFDIGYLVPTVSLLIAIVIFVSFSKYYKVTPVRKADHQRQSNGPCVCCSNSIFVLFVQIVWHGMFGTNMNCKGNVSDVDVDVDDHEAGLIKVTSSPHKIHWLDKCKMSLNGSFSDYDVESTKQVINLLIYYVYFIFYCCVYFEMFSLLYAQGCQMVCVHCAVHHVLLRSYM